VVGQPVTVETIAAALRELGLGAGDKIVMHSDLRALAKPRVLVKMSNTGMDALVDGFLKVVGPEGLVCLPTFTKAFAMGLCGDIYDPVETPSRVGSITNLFRKRPNAVRSLHPTHPWAAIGKDAEAFVAGHDETSTFGRDSICGRLYDEDAKIVWFGTTGTTNTATHFPEDWLDLPYMTSEDALVKDGDSWKRVTVYRSPSGPRDFYRNGCKLDALLERWDIQTTGAVHDATVRVMRARDFLNLLTRALIDDPCLLMKSGVDDAYHTRMYVLVAEHMERMKKLHGGVDGVMAFAGCTKE